MRRYWMAILAVIVLALAPVDGKARPPAPDRRCTFVKLTAVGAEARSRLRCEARAVRGRDLPGCAAAAASRRDRVFRRRDSMGGCVTSGDSLALAAVVDDAVMTTATTLHPNGPRPSECTRRQLDASARAIGRLALDHARDVFRSDPSALADGIAATRTEFDRAFLGARASDDCLSLADSNEVFAQLLSAVERFRSLLTSPAATCPCWTTALLDERLPPSFFVEDFRGGLHCDLDGTLSSISAVDTCDVVTPEGTYTFWRGAAYVHDAGTCWLFPDVDQDDNGRCDAVSFVYESGLTAAELDACVDTLRASMAYASCP